MFNLLESLDLGCGVGAGRDSEDVFTVSTCTGGGGGGEKNGMEGRVGGGGGWGVTENQKWEECAFLPAL